MRFSEVITVGLPVAIAGAVLYGSTQRWLCHPEIERGTHWRGLVLKISCWPTFLLGTMLALFRREIPYIPTAKGAVRGRFLRLAWPSLVLIGIYLVTLLRVIYLRMRSSEGSLELSSEAIWGMLGFATIPVIAAAGSVYAAWQARVPPSRAPWDEVNIEDIGGMPQ